MRGLALALLCAAPLLRASDVCDGQILSEGIMMMDELECVADVKACLRAVPSSLKSLNLDGVDSANLGTLKEARAAAARTPWGYHGELAAHSLACVPRTDRAADQA